MIVPLSTFATTSTTTTSQSCDIFISWLNPAISGNNQTIFGSQFFTNYFGVFTNNYTTTPATQTAQFYLAQFAPSTALLSSSPRTNGNDVFPVPSPTPKTHTGLIIGLGCAVGALLIGIIVVVVLLVKQKRSNGEIPTEAYGTATNPSGELLAGQN